MSSTDPLDRLCEAIHAELERDPRGTRLARLLGDYALAHDDWKRFALFDAATYSRNLVQKDERYELMVVCWGMWQESPIHNNAGQHCWMVVLEGDVEEIHYSVPEGGGIAKGRSSVFRRGSVAYINDEIALHKVRPAAGLAGVTLHLYASPIESCNVYDETTGRVVPRKLAYHSVAGTLTRA
jgi:cysteine dioxygenase